MDNKTEEMVINFGSFGYDIGKMSNILGYNVHDFMMDKESEFYKAYKRGEDLADYAIDQKLFEMARAGDIKALDKLEIRKSLRTKK